MVVYIKPLFVEPIYDEETNDVLDALDELAKDHPEFEGMLVQSLEKADSDAKDELNKDLYAALPYGENTEYHTDWPRDFDSYKWFLRTFSHWVPQQSHESVWTAKGQPQGEHQEVYDHLCFFYWLIDQQLDDGGTLQDYEPFRDWLVKYADLWGAILDRPGSFNQEMLEIIEAVSPKYEVENSMIGGEHPRPNNPSGWMSFNQFFARELNPGLRPIASPGDNTIITAPADCTYKKHFEIDEDSQIEPTTVKGTHTYYKIQDLLSESRYAEHFAGGHFVHLFLGPYSYHRFHTPVAGIVKECYPLEGRVYLRVTIANGQFDAADSAADGYEFHQARGVIVIDTTNSPAGDVGLVAVLPIGMCQVSGVNMTFTVGEECAKGEEFGYFTFGGSDIIVLTQKGTDPVYNPEFVPNTDYYSRYGTKIADLKL